MAADLGAGLFGGSISHHQALDAPPMVQHAAPAPEAPPLVLHNELVQHGQPAPDFWFDQTAGAVESTFDQIEQTLASAHQLTGMNSVRTNYGFNGLGQTVAVIDSGIAYNHAALGGGYGANYRVVGGWDFAENDADPYDDGPDGFHGSHVAGIVGSSDATNRGVASGVDLVGLRVFSDTGAGYFSWVESALRWVHQNRFAFENPITAVNLSLGTEWNSSTIPNWAMLEDEFAQLEADGIFIAVSAGNSFSTYNQAGLSYPAASPYVVPVMSVDDNGLLSYFSQRHTRAIAAPGRYISSTVPDYAGNNNGIADDWASASGTSMASPYVAGASVVIRQAMQFVGRTNITQDVIYDHMMATADTFTDSVTGQSYKRLNMASAINALMPVDDFGSTQATAFNLGTLTTGSTSRAGVISTLTDADVFKFTASANGRVTFMTSGPTHNFSAAWQGLGTTGTVISGGAGFQINVTAGQTYTVSLGSSGGLGYYQLAVTTEVSNPFTFVDWGTAATQQTRTGLTAGSTAAYYRVVAGQGGYVTAQAQYASGSVNLDVVNSSMQLLSTGASGRVDYVASAGQEVFLRISGAASNVSINLTNAVSVNGANVTINGTTGADTFAFTVGTQHTVSLNGVSYSFSSSAATSFTLNGASGTDAVTINGSTGNETVSLRAGDTRLSGGGYSVVATGFESALVNSGGGSDVAVFYDSAGDDLFTARVGTATLTGGGASLEARGFKYATGVASSGVDTADLYDGATNDWLESWMGFSYFASTTGEFIHQSVGFDHVRIHATAGGNDSGYLHDSHRNDKFIGRVGQSVMQAQDGSMSNTANGFDAVYGFAGYGGVDTAELYDSAGNDFFVAGPTYAYVRYSGALGLSQANGFESVLAYASTGTDNATLYDSASNDRLEAWLGYVNFLNTAGTWRHQAWGFDSVTVNATAGGVDVAYLFDSHMADRFTSYAGSSSMQLATGGMSNTANGFETVQARAVYGGNDTADLYDTAAADVVYGRGDYAEMVYGSQTRRATGFENVNARLTGGGADQVDVSAVDYVFQQLNA